MVGVATNQPDVGAGTVALTVIEEMHRQLTDVVAVDAIAVCYEDPGSGHRKAQNRARVCYMNWRAPGAWIWRRAIWSATVPATSRRAGGRGARRSHRPWIRRRGQTLGSGRHGAVAGRGGGVDCATCGGTAPRSVGVMAKGISDLTLLNDLKIKIFADGADLTGILEMARNKNPLIKGFTTNPTLMRKAGVTDYEAFAARLWPVCPTGPVSFEVFADEFADMEARRCESPRGAKTSTSRFRLPTPRANPRPH